MTTTAIPTFRNGIDVQALQGCIDAVRDNPAKGQTSWAVTSRWAGGTRSDHQVESCFIGGQEIPRKFTIRADEPLELCGTNAYPNPQELLLAGLNACMTVGYTAVAALLGVKLTRVEIRTTGDIDLRGFLGLDPSVPAGYADLEQTVTLSGNGTAEQMAQIHETVKKTSPNFYNLTRAVPVKSKLVVE